MFDKISCKDLITLFEHCSDIEQALPEVELSEPEVTTADIHVTACNPLCCESDFVTEYC